MKKIYLFFIAFVLMAVVSCQDENAQLGQGSVNLKVALNETVGRVARTSEQQLAESCTLYVYNSKNLIRKYHGISEIPQSITLLSGDYKAVAWAGDSVAASFTRKYFKGETPFTVKKNEVASATVTCKIANVVVSVKLDESVKALLKDYSVSVNNGKGSLLFNADNIDTAKGYYMMSGNEKNLNWTIKGLQANTGAELVKEGVIENVKPATEYTLTLKYNQSTEEIGGAWITVEVDETTIDVNEEVVITPAPRILGSGFDISNPLIGESGKFRKTIVYISSASALQSVELTSDYFTTIGLPTTSFDFVNMSQSAIQEIAAKGITFENKYNEVEDNAIAKLSFDASFMNALQNGIYNITVKATDASKKTSSKNLEIQVSDAYVQTLEVNPAEVNVYSATIRGNIVKPESQGCGFNYRVSGSADWIPVEGVVAGESFSAKLTGLQPKTTYEFVAKTGTFTGIDVKTFTTGEALQLPNSGFEDWFTAGDGALVPSTESGMFWDTGNHGTITLKVNITTAEKTIKHGGNNSVKMESKFVAFLGIGKFAAGNIFSGKYLKTDGTNGVLGFGRKFSARPKALRAFVKYNPGTVDNVSGDLPEVKSGDLDKGILYIALMDETTKSFNGENWPCIIKTKPAERILFSKNDPNVIGYGEYVFNSATDGEGMIEVLIPIDYTSDKIPTNVLVVASASKGGDYFVGSTTSVMYLDDVELVYE